MVETTASFGFFAALFFFRTFAAAFPSARSNFAIFISLGAVVRSCFTCVGTSVGWTGLAEAAMDVNQGAVNVGTESSMDVNAANPGVSLCCAIYYYRRCEEKYAKRTSMAITATRRRPIAFANVNSAPLGRGIILIGSDGLTELKAAASCGR